MNTKYGKYKNTKLFWLGKIPESWELVRFKNLAIIKNGKDQKEVLIEEGGFPIFGTGGEFGRATQFLYDQPSVLLGRKGTINKPQFVEEPFWTVDTLFYTEIRNDVNPKYLFYISQIMPFDLLQESSAVPSMTQEKLRNVFLCKPTINEQTQIARYLDYQCTIIDDLISKKEQLIERLQELRQATINEAVTRGLDPKTKMKESGIEWLGEYPSSWNLTQLRHLISKAGSGVTPRGGAEVYTDEGVIFIRSQNVHFDGLRLDDVVKIDPEIHSKMSGSRVSQNDVLLNITGASIGRCCVVTIDKEMNVNQHVCILRSNGKILPEYLNLVLQSNIGQLQVKNGATGGNREGLTLEALKEFIIPVPEVTIQADLVSKVTSSINELVALVKMNIQQIDNLKEYRQSLISEAVTGKIDVREWRPSYKI